jgi:hypothetical protein
VELGHYLLKTVPFFCFKINLSYICTRKNRGGFSSTAGRESRFAGGSLVHLTKFDSVAQLVEHIPFKDGVLGSNPSWITKKKKELILIPFFMPYSETVNSTGEAKSHLEFKAKVKVKVKVRLSSVLLLSAFILTSPSTSTSTFMLSLSYVDTFSVMK